MPLMQLRNSSEKWRDRLIPECLRATHRGVRIRALMIAKLEAFRSFSRTPPLRDRMLQSGRPRTHPTGHHQPVADRHRCHWNDRFATKTCQQANSRKSANPPFSKTAANCSFTKNSGHAQFRTPQSFVQIASFRLEYHSGAPLGFSASRHVRAAGRCGERGDHRALQPASRTDRSPTAQSGCCRS